MRKATKTIVASLVIMLAIVGVSAPAMAVPAYTTDPTIGGIEFIGSGSAAYNYTFHVAHPAALGTDAAYWNLTVYADPTGSASTNGTYYAHIYIDDGTTNITQNVTLAVKNDQRVYSNASFTDAAFGVLYNGSAVYYVTLASSAGTILAVYSGHVSIGGSESYAMLISLIMIMIPLVVLVMLFDKMRDSFPKK